MTMTTTYLDLVAEKATGRVTEEVRREIGGLVSEGGVISEPAELRTYECDGLTGFQVVPALVVLPASTEEVRGGESGMGPSRGTRADVEVCKLKRGELAQWNDTARCRRGGACGWKGCRDDLR